MNNIEILNIRSLQKPGAANSEVEALKENKALHKGINNKVKIFKVALNKLKNLKTTAHQVEIQNRFNALTLIYNKILTLHRRLL